MTERNLGVARLNYWGRKPVCDPGIFRPLGGKRNRHRTGNRFSVFQAVGNHSQGKRFGGSQGLLSRSSIDCNARKGRDVGNPPPIVFTRKLDFKVKRLSLGLFFHAFKLSVAETQSGTDLDIAPLR
jgi:hypothetical protein